MLMGYRDTLSRKLSRGCIDEGYLIVQLDSYLTALSAGWGSKSSSRDHRSVKETTASRRDDDRGMSPPDRNVFGQLKFGDGKKEEYNREEGNKN
jgi:hypothetical protein